MKKSEITLLIENILLEYGKKGAYKPEWDKEDQILAMFNSLYGVEELGVTKKFIANKIIGTSLVSFIKQTSNFDYLDGRGGFKRPHQLQTEVYNEYKDLPKEKFKMICQEIITKKENDPDSFNKYMIGNEIGDKRDQLKKERDSALLKLGRNPKRMTLISSRPLDPDNDDIETDNTNDITSEPSIDKKKMTPTEEIVDYMDSVISKLKEYISNGDLESVNKIVTDIEFIKDYISDQSVDSNTISEIKNIFFKKDKIKNKVNNSKKVIYEHLKKLENTLIEQKDLDELNYEGLRDRDDLQILRNSLDKNKTVGVAYVKKDGSVRHMCIKKYLKSYVPSEKDKSEKQINVSQNNNIKRVIDINTYIKKLKETGDKNIASATAWRTINLDTVLGFTTGGQFIDLRDENEIRERFGDDIYNSLTKTMIQHIQIQQQENDNDVEEIENEINENFVSKKLLIDIERIKKLNNFM